MASPNNYLTGCSTVVDLSRNSVRAGVTYDLTQAPWNPLTTSQFKFTVGLGTAPGGPFLAAALADISSACTPVAQPVPLNGGTDTLVGVKGLTHNTAYYLHWVVLDENNIQVDDLVCGPFTTPDYPSLDVCLTNTISDTSARAEVGSNTGLRNSGCTPDNFTLELSDVGPGGPWVTYPATSSPARPIGPLTPQTQYWYRFTGHENNSERIGDFGPSVVCTFTTLQFPIGFHSCGHLPGLTDTVTRVPNPVRNPGHPIVQTYPPGVNDWTPLGN